MKPFQAKKLIDLNKQTYDQIAESFSDTRNSLWPELKSFSHFIKDNQNILDLGCGNGRLIKLIDKNDVKYTGLDNSKGLIKIANRIYPNHHFRIGNLYNLPFKDNNFDLVFAIASLHHIPSNKLRERTIEEIERVLKPGGKTIISVWNLSSPKYQKLTNKSNIQYSFLEAGDMVKPWGNDKQHHRYYHAFSQNELIDLIKAKKFKVLKKKFTRYNYWIVGKKRQ